MSDKQKAPSMKWAAATLGVVVIVIAVSIAALSLRPDKVVNNFEDCRSAGGMVLEMYPEQCRINGDSYTNEEQKPQLPIDGNDYIGLSESDALARAKKENTPARVVERDGEGLPVTMDFAFGRHNLYVKDGAVYKVEIEGQATDSSETVN